VGLDAVGLDLLLADLLADLLLVGDGLSNPSCRLETDDSGRLAATLAARHLLDAARLAFDDPEATVAERGGTLVSDSQALQGGAEQDVRWCQRLRLPGVSGPQDVAERIPARQLNGYLWPRR
jgi:hypothetical protein